MSGLPVVLDLSGQRTVLVGCGSAGARKLAALVDSGTAVTVIDPVGDDALDATHIARAAGDQVRVLRRRWQPGDADGARVVVIATDDPEVNEASAADATACHALVLRCDRPDAGDLRLPAVHRAGRVTVAIDTQSASPTLAAYLRDLTVPITDGWAALAAWAADNRPVTTDDLEREHDRIRTTAQEHHA